VGVRFRVRRSQGDHPLGDPVREAREEVRPRLTAVVRRLEAMVHELEAEIDRPLIYPPGWRDSDGDGSHSDGTGSLDGTSPYGREDGMRGPTA
jgi:hypothetical protein